ncbi:uncharacterized protein LOC114758036 [Neltuma alba]|uniref:uncharacterized protein LOC114758036 n=1 Tax=Neltuma alba TaxID=207710 RepID=UPI0010A2B978|nr:uncharacterized protein LOC114758036 [Prosopis alba]
MPSTAAELTSLLIGLRLCKQYKYQRVVAYTDSTETIQLLMQDGGPQHPYWVEIEEIRELIYSDWDVKIRHAPRETIRCADFLARMAHNLMEEYCVWTNPPTGCLNQLGLDSAQPNMVMADRSS